ncbi:MAG: hypothetical protein NXI12_07055 [Alphaproteobacteria bacterium]|nr:hypothetical protein [Alphaproteobacteria bacterium]
MLALIKLGAAVSSLVGSEAPVGAVAACEIETEGGRRRITSLSATCETLSTPAESAALQSAADQVLNRVALPIRLGRHQLLTTIVLRRFHNGWDLEQTLPLAPVRYSLEQHRRARGLLYIDCAGRGLIEADGSLPQAEWVCLRKPWGEIAESDQLQADHLAGLMQQGRWLVPLRFEQGCAEAGISQRHSFPEGNPVIREDERPSCNSEPFGATHNAHQPMIPLNAAAHDYSAHCTAEYSHDANGVIHRVEASCLLADESGILPESFQQDWTVLRAAYEGSVEVGLRRMRVEETDPGFEGLREASRQILLQINDR